MAISKISYLTASQVLHTAVRVGETKSSRVTARVISTAVVALATGSALADKIKADPSKELCAPVESAGKRFFGIETKIEMKLKELEEVLADLVAEGDKIESEVKALHTQPVAGAPGSNPDRAYSEAMGYLKDRQDHLKAQTQAVQKQLQRILYLLEADPALSFCNKGI